MPILFGAIAYRSDLPKYDEFLDEWLDKSIKPAPSVVKCPKCDVEYKLIEPDVETEGTVNSDIAALRSRLANEHPNHPPCITFRANTDPNLEDQARRICNPPTAEANGNI